MERARVVAWSAELRRVRQRLTHAPDFHHGDEDRGLFPTVRAARSSTIPTSLAS